MGLDLVSTTGQARPPSSAGAPESFNVGVGPDAGVLEEDQAVSDRSASQSGPGQTHAGGCAIRLLREAGVAPPGPAPPRGAPRLRAGKRLGKRLGNRLGNKLGNRFGKRFGKRLGKRRGKRLGKRLGKALPRLSVAPVSLSTARRSGVVAPASWAWAAAEGLAGALVMLEDEITLVVAGGGISRSLVERHGVVLLHCGRPATVVLFSATEGEPAKKKIRGNDDQTRPETPASLGRQHGRPPADASRKRGSLQDYVAKNPRVPRWSACFQLRGMGGDLRLEAWKAKRRLQAGKYGVRARAPGCEMFATLRCVDQLDFCGPAGTEIRFRKLRLIDPSLDGPFHARQKRKCDPEETGTSRGIGSPPAAACPGRLDEVLEEAERGSSKCGGAWAQREEPTAADEAVAGQKEEKEP